MEAIITVRYVLLVRPVLSILILLMPQVGLTVSWNYRQVSNINWKDYDASAFRLSAETNKPLHVFVYADWCEWCKKYETQTLETDSIRKLVSEEMIPVAVDYDKQPELANQLGIKIVPTNIVLSPDGQKLLRFHGYINKDELSTVLQRTLTAWKNGEPLIEEFGDESSCCPVPRAGTL